MPRMLGWIPVLAMLSGCCSWFQCEPTAFAVYVDKPAPVIFDNQVPENVPAELPQFTLTPSSLSKEFVGKVATSLRPGPEADTTPTTFNATHVADGGGIRSRESANGEFEIYPSFERLRKDDKVLDPSLIFERVRRSIGEAQSVLRDSNATLVIDPARVLHYARSDRTQTEQPTPTASMTKLLYVSIRRRVGDIPVEGPGSRLMLAIDASATVQGAVGSWSKIGASTKVAAARSAAMVQDEITRQILATHPVSNVHVQSIQLVYYDGGRGTLQAAYRFVAEVELADNSLGFVTEHLVGYVPYASGGDALPVFTGRSHTRLGNDGVAGATSPAGAAAPSAVRVGRYVAREDSRGWLEASRDFWAAASTTPGPIKLVDAQNLPATPEQFTGQSKGFVDAVDLALVEAHGLPYGFATRGDSNHEKVFLDIDVPANGYGPGASGNLKHWIFHSCRVVVSADDYADWAGPWWRIFNGLSGVVGYRTPMFIADGAGAAVGPSISAGAAVVPAWFNAVASLNIYSGESLAKFRCHDGLQVGRPSAITVCGSSDAPAGTAGPAPAKCLESWWIGDELVRP